MYFFFFWEKQGFHYSSVEMGPCSEWGMVCGGKRKTAVSKQVIRKEKKEGRANTNTDVDSEWPGAETGSWL